MCCILSPFSVCAILIDIVMDATCAPTALRTALPYRTLDSVAFKLHVDVLHS
ncbi:hypothetical protein PF005_g6732 [Phytophthora fragariae]|uniref:Uncharacterized protein n=1 Tax=Phytophthora fragariae TaxID=53985 RepID=A0A6A3UL43_9STRA|nr:hypothetical protein PF003_g27694 [Phytophthora fragariae]KAE8943192.1 hypothetical protein PF009_g7087 [Phytophthora fragariae]KAE9020556.1 hypothetical protein PF011_g5365 [Phytophthora fragariae]KAE9125736.1 hypothetical protein PF010_g5510 [Phytophthora fragariae]KAE9152322.1 hypothetical protein PF006_g3454 [Phytophthora fragariae]